MNKDKLYACIAHKGLSIAQVCDTVGLSRSSMYRKARGLTDFTQPEIAALVQLLDIEDPMAVFFTPEVSQTKQKGAAR